MAPGRSKAGGANTSNGGTKKPAAKAAQRKSLAADPSLYRSSSEGEGDDEDHPPASQQPARGTGKARSIPSKAVKTSVVAAFAPASSSPGTRRSTRLSGEGLPAQDVPTRTAGQKSLSSSNKRKAPPSPVLKSSTDVAQLTPPDTDADSTTENKGVDTSSRSRSKRADTSIGGLKNGKKQKVKPSAASAKTATQPLQQANPAGSDDSDDFTFTRMVEESDSAPSASQIKSSIPMSSAVASASLSSTAISKAAGAAKKGRPKPAEGSRVKATITADESEVGSSHKQPLASTSRLPATAQAHDQSTSQTAIGGLDKKGKRKAADVDTSGSGNEEALHSHPKSKVPSASSKGRQPTKKGRTADPEAHVEADATGPGTPPSASTSIPVATQETPAIKRNVAMRAGQPAPGTPGSAARRASGDLRGRRGSSIGNGFEALPHPSLPTNTLHKHIRATDPPAIRFRTLATWSMHRLKESLDSASKGYPSSVREGARQIAEAVIGDLAAKRIELAWSPQDADHDEPRTDLPPNPQNASNQAKLNSCLAWSAQLKAEDQARNVRINQYKTMTESIARLAAPPTPLPAEGETEVPDLLKPNWSLPIPRLRNKEDIVSYGRQLLVPRPPVNKGKGKAKQDEEDDPDVVDVEAELGISLKDLRHQAAEMHQTAHRLDQFIKLSDGFLKKHLEASHAALTLLSSGPAAGNAAAGSSGAANSAAHSTREHTTLLPTRNRALNPDPRDLLRALSRADTASR